MSRVLCRRIGAALALLSLCAAQRVHGRDKIDEITLTNGSFIVGEIKRLESGKLEVSTSDMGTVQIEWVAVRRMQSPQLFNVEIADGSTLAGALSALDAAGLCAIVGPEGELELELVDIVRITELERRFWSRWAGHTDFGFVYGSANAQTDVSLDAAATYTAEQFQFHGTLSGTLSDRDEATRTSRGSLTTAYQRLLRNRWFWVATCDLSRNEELDLDLRASAIGEYGRYIRRSARSQLAAAGGLAATRERYTDQDGEWNIEGVVDGLYELYLFEGRETTLATRLTVFPSLTTSGRFRVELSSSLRRKLVRDFILSLTLEESYDSKPPSTGTETDTKKSDLRFRTTLGWSF